MRQPRLKLANRHEEQTKRGQCLEEEMSLSLLGQR